MSGINPGPGVGNRVTRRHFVSKAAALAAGASALPVLAACGSSGEGSASNEITLGAFKDPSTELLRDKFLPRFTADTGIETHWLETDYATWLQKARTEAQNQTGAYDVMILDDPWIAQFGSQGLLQDLTELGVTLDSDVLSSTVDLGYWPPRVGPVPPSQQGSSPTLVAAPVIGDVISLAYRGDIFTQVPKTWDDVLAVARATSEEGNGNFGWVFAGQRGTVAVSGWTAMLYTYGGEYFDSNWQPAFNGAAGKSALEMQLELLRYSPSGCSEFGQEQEAAAVARGEAYAADIYGVFQKQVNDPSMSQVAAKMKSATPPRGTTLASLVGMFMSGVPIGAKNASGGAKFLKWFTSKRIQQEFALAGGVPVRASAFADPKAQSEAPYLNAIGASLAVAKPRPRTPEWPQVEEFIGTQLNEAYTRGAGAADVAQYLDKAAEGAHQVLERAGYYS